MADFRDLFASIGQWRRRRATPSLFYDVLEPWLAADKTHVDWLRTFGARSGDPVPHATLEDLWDLYSLSRVSDLLMQLHRDCALDDWQHADFIKALSLQERQEASFSPVLHEIAEVDQAPDTTQPTSVVSTIWPALKVTSLKA